MYKCNHCEQVFEEPVKKNTCFENYYGVSNLFNSKTPFVLLTCPSCGDDDIDELSQCECCGEYTDELYDTTEIPGGGIGYVCEDCLRNMEE